MKTAIGILCLLLLAASVSAIKVDCGPGDSLCSESELQSEFNCVDKRLEIHEVAIVMNYRIDMAQQNMIDELKSTPPITQTNYYDGGMSTRGMKKYLLGNMFDDLESVSNYFDVLKIFFVPRAEYNELQHRLDLQEAKFKAIEKHLGVEVKHSAALECSARLIEANRIGETVFWGNGWSAIPGQSSCMKLN